LYDQIDSGKLTPGGSVDNLDILSLIDLEKGSLLQVYANCFNESLRMQPPVLISSTVRMSENTTCGPLTIRKGDTIGISMGGLCNNKDEWIEPHRFIPERFDPDSKYFLTPHGTKRNSCSFTPFLGGSRICIGKSFIEAVSKLTIPVLLTKFQFEFTEDVVPEKFEYI